MASAAILSQIEGLLEQCLEEYGEDPKIQTLLTGTRAVMEELRSQGESEEGSPEEAPEMEEAASALGDFKSARKQASEDKVMSKDMPGPKSEEGRAKTEDKEQPDENEEYKRRKRTKAFS